MRPTCTLPKPVRSFRDPHTGVLIHQLTGGEEPASHLYYTRSSWLAGGKYFLFLRRRDYSVNYFAVPPSGEERQVTHLPPPPDAQQVTSHMHRRFRAWETDRIMVKIPAMHPAEPVFVYAWQNELHRVDVTGGTDELLHVLPRGESEMPFTPVHTFFSCDGRFLYFTTNRRLRPGETPPPSRISAGSNSNRDESKTVGSIWRCDDGGRGTPRRLFTCHGEPTHPLPCPWDPDCLLWANGLSNALYLGNADATDVRALFARDDCSPGHLNWDAFNRTIVGVNADLKNKQAQLGVISIPSGEFRVLANRPGPSQWHPNASPDGQWIVNDALDGLADGNGLAMVCQSTGETRLLCRIDCTWGPILVDGEYVKSEWLHPNPSWSPDGRYVVFDTDFGQGVDAVQSYAVDMATWKDA